MSSNTLSPSQRAAFHKARSLARQARRAGTPGPGSYDVKKPERSADNLAGTTAFKSGSEGTVVQKNKTHDPTRYTPRNGGSISERAFRTHNKPSQQGEGSFGHKATRAGVRDFKEPSMIGPSPTTYSPQSLDELRPDEHRGSAFSSQTKRGAYVGREVTPGAGEYEASSPDKRVPGGESTFRDRVQRFPTDEEAERTAQLGPGSHTPLQGSVDYKLKSGELASPGVRGTPAFASESDARAEEFGCRTQSGLWLCA